MSEEQTKNRMEQVMLTFAMGLLTHEQIKIVQKKTVERMKVEGYEE
tara:strand:+ start:40 stop:177 length:138 start_codon:yes stop_codon:yes gene_type:complete